MELNGTKNCILNSLIIHMFPFFLTIRMRYLCAFDLVITVIYILVVYSWLTNKLCCRVWWLKHVKRVSCDFEIFQTPCSCFLDSVASTQLPPFPLGPWAILGPCDGAPVQLAAGGSLHDLLHVKRVMLQEANEGSVRVEGMIHWRSRRWIHIIHYCRQSL